MYCVLPVMVTDKIYPLLIQMAWVLPVMVTDKTYPLLIQKAWNKTRVVEQTKFALKIVSNVCSDITKIMSQTDM